jgi:hypothetical protein
VTRPRAFGAWATVVLGLSVVGCAGPRQSLGVCKGATPGDSCEMTVSDSGAPEVSRCVDESDGTLLRYSPGLPDEGRRFPAFAEKAIH